MFQHRKKEISESCEPTPKKADRSRMVRLLVLIVLTMTLLAVYRFFLDTRFFLVVMTVYMVAFTVLAVGYVVYNRGFSRKNVTADMLPESWTEEAKNEYIESGIRRQKKSRWVLMLIFAIGFTFAFDVMELFVIPFFKQLF